MPPSPPPGLQPRESLDNPLREKVFGALHRATRELSLQRKIRLLPTTASAALFVILVMAIVLGMLSLHVENVAVARRLELATAILIGLVTLGAGGAVWLLPLSTEGLLARQ